MKDYIKLMRPKHYLKNGLVLLPLFFSTNITNGKNIQSALWGVAAFCVIASVVYVINDIRDREKDRLHPVKCNRPIASGRVSVQAAYILAGVLFLLAGLCIICQINLRFFPLFI